MFHLDDRTRRHVHVVLFGLLCLVPTAAVVGWAAWLRLPWYAADQAERLGLCLGLKVNLEGIRHPRPGLTVYEGLELCEPATGRPILRCARLEARWQDDMDFARQRRRFLMLQAPGVEVFAEQREEWPRLLDRLLAGRLGWSEACVQFAAAEVVISGQPSLPKLAGVLGRFESLARGTWAGLAFPSDDPAGRLATVCFSRERQSQGSGLHVRVDTGQGAVACPLLALGWGGLALFGPQARFAGTIEAERTAGAWDGQVAGHFSNVDLDVLVTQRFRWTLSGKAQLFLDQARVRRSRLQQAAGWVVVTQGGTVSRGLLELAAEHLGMAIPNQISAEPIQPFEQLGFWFALEEGKIRIQGRCPLDRADGTSVILGRQGPLLAGGEPKPLPLVQLARVVAPAGVTQLPLSAETVWLVERVELVAESPAVAGRSQVSQVR